VDSRGACESSGTASTCTCHGHVKSEGGLGQLDKSDDESERDAVGSGRVENITPRYGEVFDGGSGHVLNKAGLTKTEMNRLARRKAKERKVRKKKPSVFGSVVFEGLECR